MMTDASDVSERRKKQQEKIPLETLPCGLIKNAATEIEKTTNDSTIK